MSFSPVSPRTRSAKVDVIVVALTAAIRVVMRAKIPFIVMAVQ